MYIVAVPATRGLAIAFATCPSNAARVQISQTAAAATADSWVRQPIASQQTPLITIRVAIIAWQPAPTGVIQTPPATALGGSEGFRTEGGGGEEGEACATPQRLAAPPSQTALHQRPGVNTMKKTVPTAAVAWGPAKMLILVLGATRHC